MSFAARAGTRHPASNYPEVEVFDKQIAELRTAVRTRTHDSKKTRKGESKTTPDLSLKRAEDRLAYLISTREALVEKLSFLEEQMRKQKTAIQTIKTFRKDAGTKEKMAYLDKLLATARMHLADLRTRKQKVVNPNARLAALTVAIVNVLHLSLRNHLPKAVNPAVLARAAERVIEVIISGRARSSAKARHAKPGGSNDRRTKLRAEWVTGKYRTKKECANKAGHTFGMSFETAIKALRGLPKPNKN